MKWICLCVIFVVQTAASNQKEGICGRVLWIEGNQMPGPDKKKSTPHGISRELHIYEVVTLEKTVREDGFFTDIRSNLVATVRSRDNGSYRVALPPGVYSVFVREPQGLFANLFDEHGSVNPVRVDQGRFTDIDILVNYRAAY